MMSNSVLFIQPKQASRIVIVKMFQSERVPSKCRMLSIFACSTNNQLRRWFALTYVLLDLILVQELDEFELELYKANSIYKANS